MQVKWAMESIWDIEQRPACIMIYCNYIYVGCKPKFHAILQWNDACMCVVYAR